MMSLHELNPGDIVFAAKTIVNDGSVPGLAEDELIAEAGTRGVIINTGHLEEDPNRELMLVRFEKENNELGPAVGVWFDELTPGAGGESVQNES